VIFDENTVGDQATFVSPHQFPTGIGYVLVNGEVVFRDGNMTGLRPGLALRGPGSFVTPTTQNTGSNISRSFAALWKK
jgi:N-acyl-D-aspartate/D-glutamate deacylase